MDLFTMGFTKKRAEEFFKLIKRNQIELLLDIRLNNQSQLAGFTKGKDLAYFLKEICHCMYDHNILYAPTKELLQSYKKEEITWLEYERQYRDLMIKRKIEDDFKKNYSQYSKILLLCSEPTPENCHRRLLAEYLKEHLENCTIKHI